MKSEEEIAQLIAKAQGMSNMTEEQLFEHLGMAVTIERLKIQLDICRETLEKIANSTAIRRDDAILARQALEEIDEIT